MNIVQRLPRGAAVRPADHRHGGGGGPAGCLSLQETDDHADLLGIHGAKVPNYGLANHDQAGVRTDTPQEGVAALVAAGVINTPEYWLANYGTFPSLDLLLQALGGAVK